MATRDCCEPLTKIYVNIPNMKGLNPDIAMKYELSLTSYLIPTYLNYHCDYVLISYNQISK